MREEYQTQIKESNNKKIHTEILADCITNRNYIEVSIGSDSECLLTLNCIPLKMSSELIMVLELIDFLPFGFRVVKHNDIYQIKRDEVCRYYEEIVKKEGADAILDNAPEILLESLKTVFLGLRELNAVIVVDIGKEDAVNVGNVLEADDVEVSMKCFSPIGVWDDDCWVEPYKNITGISFMSHYTLTYEKYLD